MMLEHWSSTTCRIGGVLSLHGAGLLLQTSEGHSDLPTELLPSEKKRFIALAAGWRLRGDVSGVLLLAPSGNRRH